MGRNSHYFNNKEERRSAAYKHYKEFGVKYADDIKKSSRDSLIYRRNEYWDKHLISTGVITKIKVTDEDTVSALFNLLESNGTVGILNFASFKNPGGMFLNGSSAQEECLCHASTLYNVLEQKIETFYIPNKKRLNYSLYDDSLILSPGIVFEQDANIRKAHVITCAAPNAYAAETYKHIPQAEINRALVSRIDLVLYVAAHAYEKPIDTLILGAFGCGVFGNSPEIVASIFHELLDSTYRNVFNNVVFAIPGGSNLEAFQKEFMYD